MKLLTLNTLMYLLIFGTALLVGVIESKDWNCTNAYDVFSKCHEGEGMPYRGSTPSESDSDSELLDKIGIAANSYTNSIVWRRAFTMATIIALATFVLIVTPGTFPPWSQFYLVVIIGIAVVYHNINYYSYHKYRIPKQNIEKSTFLLRERIAAIR